MASDYEYALFNESSDAWWEEIGSKQDEDDNTEDEV